VPDEQASTYGPTHLGRRAVAVDRFEWFPGLFPPLRFSIYGIYFLVIAYLYFLPSVISSSISSGRPQGVGGGPGAMFVARRAATEGKGGRVGPPLG
jgi:hypothetical protein